VPPTAADTAVKAANLSAPHGLRAAWGGWEDGSPAVEEASEAVAAAAAAVDEEEEAAAVAGEAVQMESAEILGRRREPATRDMVCGLGFGFVLGWVPVRVEGLRRRGGREWLRTEVRA